MSINNAYNELQIGRRIGYCGHVHPLEQGVGCLYCRYIVNGWLTRAYLCHHSIIPYYCSTVMARNPFLIEMEGLLRITMLFGWLRGDYGPLDRPTIGIEDIKKVWVELVGTTFYPHGVFFPSSLKFYVQKEFDFWEEVKTGAYRVMPGNTKKPQSLWHYRNDIEE